MELILSAVFGWFTSKVLDRIFFRKKSSNAELIGVYERRLAEKDEHIQKLEKAQKKREKEKRRIIQSLKRSGLSTDKLVDRYDKPLNAILISYVTQVEPTGTGYYRRCKFVQDEIKRFNAKSLGGADFLIPPAKVPKEIKNRDDLESWFEKEILKGRYCKLRFLILFDLRKKSFWKSYVPYTQKNPWNYTIGEVLDVEDLFTEEQINRIALSNIIRDGDIVWLSSGLLSGTELEKIHSSQTLIEDKLGNPTLGELADDNVISELSVALKDIGISNPEEVSKAIVDEAKFWHSRLKS
jgi:hypothetical protein